jgi:ABC-2 type transport system permease protein
MKALAREIKKYWSVFVYYKKVDFLGRLAYRYNFFLMLIGVFAKVFFNLVFINVVFSWVKNIQGWSYSEALLIVGTVMLIDGLMWTSVAYLHIIKYLVRNGQLDGLITKPIDSQFIVSVHRGDLEDIVRVITGLAVIIFAFSQLSLGAGQFAVNLFWYLLLVITVWL